MEARLQESLSQEGTGMSGESLPESDSGSPTYSGRGNILPTHNVETITLDDDDNETIIVEDDDSDTTKEPIRPKLNIRNSSDGTESEPSTSGLQNKLTNKNQYIEITNLTRKLGTLTDNMIKLVDNNPTTIKELKNGIWDIKNHLDCLNERLRESGEDLPCSEDVATQTQNMDLIDDIKAKIRTKDVSEILDTDWPEEVYTAVTVEKGGLDTIDSDWDVVVIVMPKTETDEASELEKQLLTKRPEANGLLQGIEAGAVKFVLCTVLQIERCTFVLPCALTVADMLTQFIALYKKSNELSRSGKFAVFVESSLNVTNTRKIMEAAFLGSGAKGKILIEKDTVDVERPDKRKSETVTTEEVTKKAKNDVTAVDSKETGITVESVQMVIKELAEAGWGEFLGEELPFKLDVANIGVPNTINNLPSTSGMGRNEQGSHLEEIVSNTLETARNAGHPRLQGMVGAGTSAGLQRSYIWSGVIEWMEKGKTPGDQQKTTKHLHCQVSASTKDIEPELKVDTWPNKLLMQLMPKQLISNIGGQYLKDSKSVLFHLQPSEALDALTKVMVNGFAGCVHFSQIPSPPQCDIKVLILLYTPDKKAYLGFIPNNQATFVDRLRKVIQQQKISQIISKQQIPAPVSAAGGLPPNMATSTMAGTGAMPTPGMSSGGMGAGMSSGMQPVSVGNVGNVGNVGQMPGPGPSQGMVQTQMQQHPQGMMISGGMGGQVQQVGGKGPRPVTQLDGLEAARQQNLEKIQHLQQTLEAAHQQEAQFKSQMDIMSHLHAAQQQEQHYKQLEEQRKHQLQQQLQQQLRGNTAHQPRIMHPRNILPSNPGLRHLLQQQPQYRAGGGAPRPSSQPQQFDDVTNYTDFI